MRKDTEQNNQNEKDTFLEKEVWLTIRYLDPDTRSESNGAVVVALLAIVSIVCAVSIVLYVRGL
jgi:hypothetical protein